MLLSIDGELEKDRFQGLEVREPNDTKKFTSQVLSISHGSILDKLLGVLKKVHNFNA